MPFLCLVDRTDRLGSVLMCYISTVLIAKKHGYRIQFTKAKADYKYSESLFVDALFHWIDIYNETVTPHDSIRIYEDEEFFKKMVGALLSIQSDFVTAFKTMMVPEFLNELALRRSYVLPFDPTTTIAVHLRLEDKANCFVTLEDRTRYSNHFRRIVDSETRNFPMPQYQSEWAGQSAMKDSEVIAIIEYALRMHPGFNVVVVTNGTHELPYTTICSEDPSFDLFLLTKAAVLIGSMSTYSFVAMMYGSHRRVYYPLWDHAVCFWTHYKICQI